MLNQIKILQKEQEPDIKDRIGFFIVDEYFILNQSLVLTKIIENFIITNVQHFPASKRLKYTAMSLLFDKIKNNDPVPQYEIIITKQNDPQHDIVVYDLKVNKIKEAIS